MSWRELARASVVAAFLVYTVVTGSDLVWLAVAIAIIYIANAWARRRETRDGTR